MAEPRPGSWFGDLSLSTKTSITFIVLVLSYVLIGTAFQATQNYALGTREGAERVYQNLDSAERLEVEALNMLRSLRNALLRGDTASTDEFAAALSSYDDAVVVLRLGVAGRSEQELRIQRVDAIMNRWQASFAGPMLEQLARQRLTERSDLAVQELLRMVNEADQLLPELRALLQEVRVQEREVLMERNAAARQANRIATITAQGFTLLGLLAALIGWRTSRLHLVQPVDQLTASIVRVAQGETGLDVPYTERRDEVGSFARALAKLQDAMRSLAHGNWLRSALAGTHEGLQTCATHEEFAGMLLRQFSSASSAVYALAYRWDEESGKLWFSAGRGVTEAELGDRNRFFPGQGLVGQCYADAQPLSIAPVPEGHAALLSGVGSSPLGTLLLLPLRVGDEVVAVVELGFIEVPSTQARDYLDEAGRSAALAWLTLSRSLRTEELLETTQAQAQALQLSEDTLRVQQDELTEANDALRERTLLLELQQRRLKASEEELRAQTETLRSTNTTLEERTATLHQRQLEIEDARRQLELRAEQLEEASRYKSEFLANMSHELRTPLNSLLILSKSLADNEDGNLNADQVESARIVHDSGRNLLNLINDILDLSKVEAGKLTINFERVALRDVAQVAERAFRHVADSRGLALNIQVAAGLPDTIVSDGVRLGQVLANLLSNALKFTHQGGVSLDVQRPDPAQGPRLPGLDLARCVAFVVRDSGIGIDPQRVEQVFQPFEQGDGSTSRRYGGTGLGLSIVRGLSQLLGGQVIADSTPGQGSCFTLVLPEAFVEVPAALSSAVAAAPASVPAAHDAAVLIVEDDLRFAGVLSSIAARSGCRVLVAHTGAEALALASRLPLRGVLLDLGLPDMSGWQVLEALRSLPGGEALPVHIISGVEDSGGHNTLVPVGFLTKPVTREGVLGALRKLGAGPGGWRALLIDDDPGSRYVVRQLLDPMVGSIDEAVDGQSGLARLQQDGPYDCVILDLGLPDFSGFDWLDRASRLTRLPSVVIYSGRSLSPAEEQHLQQYTSSIVVKGEHSEERLLEQVLAFLKALRAPPAVTAACAETTPAPTPAPVTALKGHSVLVVDDDMRNVFALSRALGAQGMTVHKAPDGQRALAILDTTPDIDIVLMDIMMPGMDGYQAMGHIRAQPRFSALPIIAVTAKAMKGDRERCLEAGANDYCAKPIDIDALLAQIRHWLGIRGVRSPV